jgi:hypothetical protein
MNRPISTKAHGMIDYAWVTAAETLPGMMNGASETANLIRRAGAAAGLNAMMTNYEAGVMRLLPMKGHLAFDLLMCATLVMSPLFLPREERRYAAIPVVLGAIGLLTSVFTQTEAPMDRREGFLPSRELSEAVADPDAGRSPGLRTHLE